MVADKKNEVNRQHNRVPFKTSISLEYGGKTATFQHTIDISMNGVFIRTAKPLRLGVKGSCVLSASVGMRIEKIEGEFEVVRSISLDDGLSEEDPGPGMGLKFTELEPDSSVMLYQIIRHNQPL